MVVNVESELSQLKVKENEKENVILIGFLCGLNVLCADESVFVPCCS